MVATTVMAEESCFVRASAKYNIPSPLLKAISEVESAFNPMAINLNHKTYDIGLMQVNSQHLNRLAKYGIEARDLYDPCTNIDVGAWILSKEIARNGYNWEAVGRYHSPTKSLQVKYIARVARALEKYR